VIAPSEAGAIVARLAAVALLATCLHVVVIAACHRAHIHAVRAW
jgi:hypothetical protein